MFGRHYSAIKVLGVPLILTLLTLLTQCPVAEAEGWYASTQHGWDSRDNTGKVWINGRITEQDHGCSPGLPDSIGVAAYYIANGRAHLTRIDVIPEYQKKGIGKALMKRFIEQVQEHGVSEVKLLVEGGNSNTAAVKLYKKFGFKWEDAYDRTNHYMKLNLNTYQEPAGIN
ncbi:acetyltransferase (GNAT) family domain-containing protein [Ditylenchus destructor]|nr:acetyltransferase (GNAT) family domain-containing protein [Ditylenchus destructor]